MINGDNNISDDNNEYYDNEYCCNNDKLFISNIHECEYIKVKLIENNIEYNYLTSFDELFYNNILKINDKECKIHFSEDFKIMKIEGEKEYSFKRNKTVIIEKISISNEINNLIMEGIHICMRLLINNGTIINDYLKEICCESAIINNFKINDKTDVKSVINQCNLQEILKVNYPTNTDCMIHLNQLFYCYITYISNNQIYGPNVSVVKYGKISLMIKLNILII